MTEGAARQDSVMNVVVSILEHDLLFQFKSDDKVATVSSCVEELLGSTKFEFQCKDGTIPDPSAPISKFETASNLVEFEISLNGCALWINVRRPSGRVEKWRYPDSKVNEQLIREIASDLHTEPDRVMLFYKGQRFCPIPLRPWYTDDDEIVVVVKETRPLLVFEKSDGDKTRRVECYCGRDEDWKGLVAERMGVEKFIIKSRGVVVSHPFGVDGEIQVEEQVVTRRAEGVNRMASGKGKLFCGTIEVPEGYDLETLPANVELRHVSIIRKELVPIEVTHATSTGQSMKLNVTAKTTANELANFLGEDYRLSYENHVLSDETLVAGLNTVKLESKHVYQIDPALPDGTQTLEIYSTVVGELKRAIARNCRKPIECVTMGDRIDNDPLHPNVTYSWKEKTVQEITVRVVLPHLFLVTVCVKPDDKVETLKEMISKKYMNNRKTTDFKLFVENQQMEEDDEIWNWCYEREDDFPVIVKMEVALPLRTVSFEIDGISVWGRPASTTITGHFSDLWTFRQVGQWISSKAKIWFNFALENSYTISAMDTSEPKSRRVKGDEDKSFIGELKENSNARFKVSRSRRGQSSTQVPNLEAIQVCPLGYQAKLPKDALKPNSAVDSVLAHVQQLVKRLYSYGASDFTILTSQAPRRSDLVFKSYCLYKGRLTRVTNWTKSSSAPDHYILNDEDTIEIPQRVPVDRVLLRYSETCLVTLNIKYPTCKLFARQRAQAKSCYRCYTLIQAKNDIIRDWNLQVESLDDITFRKKGTKEEIIDLCQLAPYQLPEEGTKMDVDLCVKLPYPVGPKTKYDVDKTLSETLGWDECCIEGQVLNCREWKFGDLCSLPYRFESILKADASHVTEVTLQWRQKQTDHKKRFRFTDDAHLDHVLLCGLDFVQSFLSDKVIAEFSGVLPPEWFALIHVTQDGKITTIPNMTKTLGDFKRDRSVQEPLEFIIVEVPDRMLRYDRELAATNSDTKLGATFALDGATSKVSASEFNGKLVVGKALVEDGKGCNPNRCVEFFREVGLLYRFLKHPCVVKTVGYFIYRDRTGTATIYYLMTRLLKDLSLEKATESGTQRTDFCPTSRSIVLFGCAETYADLQDLGFVMRDIKPANILLKLQNIKEHPDSANHNALPVLCPVTCDYGLVKIDARNEGNSTLPTPMYKDERVEVGERFEPKYDIHPFIEVIKRTYGINNKEEDLASKDDEMGKFKQRIRDLTQSTDITMRELANKLRKREYHYPGTREEIFQGYVKYLDQEKGRFHKTEIMNGRKLDDLKNGTGLLEQETWDQIEHTTVDCSRDELPGHLRPYLIHSTGSSRI